MISIISFVVAAVTEIAGCFAFWAWLRLDKSIWWLVPGMAALALFAYFLTFAEVTAAGRAYAAYGGIYIAASLAWLWIVEGTRPDRWDSAGVALCLVGAGVILFGPRHSATEQAIWKSDRVERPMVTAARSPEVALSGHRDGIAQVSF